MFYRHFHKNSLFWAILFNGLMFNIAFAQDTVLSIDSFVPHVSTVPANQNQIVGLHLRERVLESTKKSIEKGSKPEIILFIHGGFSPSTVAYDLNYKDFSWMENLAKEGFDTFALTMTAYGSSPRPYMDDPCNVDPKQQAILIPHILKAPCAPHYPFKLVSSQTEWDEVEAAVKHILKIRGVDKINLVGWSTGTPRIGGFAAKHPEMVKRILFLAPAPFFDQDKPPTVFPEPGSPILLQTRERLEGERWMADVKCSDQIDDKDIRDVMWKELMLVEGAGANWIPGGVMRAPNRMNYGWRENVSKIKAPTLILLGEFDNFEARQDAWKALKVEKKAFLKIACGSHYLQYERQRPIVFKATKEWFMHGTINGKESGYYSADSVGSIK